MFSKQVENHRYWTLGLSLWAFVLAIIIGFVLWQSAHISSVIELENNVSSFKSVFDALRPCLIGLIVALWPVLIKGFDRWRGGRSADRAQLLALRWRVGGWLILLELVLGQNLLTRFVAAIRGVGT